MKKKYTFHNFKNRLIMHTMLEFSAFENCMMKAIVLLQQYNTKFRILLEFSASLLCYFAEDEKIFYLMQIWFFTD